ncbi:MAG TPA: DUF1652 domain-containing protein [Pseudomonas sp.]|nr:DUF1652 domain-containing protein [Pseudomonas sp.]
MTIFLSTLEIQNLIERALLPDHCVCLCNDGVSVNLTLRSVNQPTLNIHIDSVPLSSLQSSRAIAELIGEARYLLVQAGRQRAGINA